MGEIGISPDRFRYGLLWWEIKAIIRGYNRRDRSLWSATRWQTYNLMAVSMADLKKAGIYKPTDLITFPWEKEHVELPSDEEVAEMQQLIASMNASNQQT